MCLNYTHTKYSGNKTFLISLIKFQKLTCGSSGIQIVLDIKRSCVTWHHRESMPTLALANKCIWLKENGASSATIKCWFWGSKFLPMLLTYSWAIWAKCKLLHICFCAALSLRNTSWMHKMTLSGGTSPVGRHRLETHAQLPHPPAAWAQHAWYSLPTHSWAYKVRSSFRHPFGHCFIVPHKPKPFQHPLAQANAWSF